MKHDPTGGAAADLPLQVRPQLVASDLDGTLLPPDLRIDPALVAAIAALRDAGAGFVVCTGRMVKSAAAMAARLGVPGGLAVCYSGAVVVDLDSGEWLVHAPLEALAAVEVVRHARRIGRHLNVFTDDEFVVEDDDEWTRWTASYIGIEPRIVDDLAALVAERPPTKIVLAADPAEVVGLLPDLQARWSDRLMVTRSLPHFIEINDCGAGKSRALGWLQADKGIGGPTVACGDGLNDLDMLAWADLSVAVAEGDEEVRAAADLVVPRAALPALFERLSRLPTA
jgi:Cof subfamily protein (haloacid dehalogenase superfamily)